MTRLPGTIWPSESQRLVLTAALADPSSAVAAWQAVRPHGSIHEDTFGAFQLLPLIYRNLDRAGQNDADLQLMKGIYRRAWARNSLFAERMKLITDTLDRNGIRAEFVEGVTIASRFYGELGLRPTSAIDVLIDAVDSSKALGVLARAGWTERRELAIGRHYESYVFDSDANACLVRTRLAPDIPSKRAGARPPSFLWGSGDRHSVGDVEVPVPPPTEALFAVCVTHARIEPGHNLQWIVDAKMVLQVDVDWDRLVALGRESGQVSRLHDALVSLASLPGPTPPREICDRLATTPVSRRQRISYLFTVGAISGPRPLQALLGEHLAATTERSVLGVVAAFPGFLRMRWSLARTWHVPFAAGKRAVRLLGQRERAT